MKSEHQFSVDDYLSRTVSYQDESVAPNEERLKKDTQQHESTIAACITRSVTQYFYDLKGERADGLYQLVLGEVERPLLNVVMDFTGNNQTEAARILGINRNTLRKKLINNGFEF